MDQWHRPTPSFKIQEEDIVQTQLSIISTKHEEEVAKNVSGMVDSAARSSSLGM